MCVVSEKYLSIDNIFVILKDLDKKSFLQGRDFMFSHMRILGIPIPRKEIKHFTR